MQNTRCAIRIVRYPVVIPIVAKKTSVATAVTISGTSSGRLISANVAPRPRNAPARTIATAAATAITVAAVEAISAIDSELRAAAAKIGASGPVKTSAYQRSENPSHFWIEALELNE